MGETTFRLDKHGLAMINDFRNDFVSEIDWRTGGLCGGMAYTALDYFNAGRSAPWYDWRPAVHTQLHDYIYNRQVHSITSNLDKWIELGANPFGVRNTEFFRWGLQGTNGGRLAELRKEIDAGRPVPLGLQARSEQKTDPGNHQVLAIGYDMGRYRGDLGAYQTDLRIRVYEPNKPGQIRTLRPNTNDRCFYYQEDPSKVWRTYFVDRKYERHTPPTVRSRNWRRDGRYRMLLVNLKTGSDDLRKGSRVDMRVDFHGQRSIHVLNINRRRRWIDNYWQSVEVWLPRSVAKQDIAKVVLTADLGNDKWHLDAVQVKGYTSHSSAKLSTQRGNPLMKVTGRNRTFTHVVTPPRARPRPRPQPRPVRRPVRVHRPVAERVVSARVIITTGNDDLRGGNDNAHCEFVISGYGTKRFGLNRGAKWKDRSTHHVDCRFGTGVPMSAIRTFRLGTNFGSGFGSDKWNVDRVRVEYRTNTGRRGVLVDKRGAPLVRFTGNRKSTAFSVRAR